MERSDAETTEKGRDAEVVFWDSIKNSTDPEDYQAYLKQYPQGIYADLAHKRLRTPRKNSVGMEFVYIPTDSFLMGSTEEDINRVVAAYQPIDDQVKRESFTNELPQHRVTISQSFKNVRLDSLVRAAATKASARSSVFVGRAHHWALV